MTDLSRLFATSPGEFGREDANRAAGLEELVGPALPEADGIPTEHQARPLSDLVGSVLPEADGIPTQHQSRPLSELVGTGISTENPRTRDQAPALAALLSAPAAEPVTGPPAGSSSAAPPSTGGQKGFVLSPRRRVSDFLNAGVAVLAVLVLVAAVVGGVVQRLSADPAAEALVSLGEREAELRNDLQMLATSEQMYQSSVDSAVDLATQVEGTLAALRGRVAAGPVDEAEAARSNVATLAARSRPAATTEYVRADIDTTSFAAVARAIDRVRAVREQVPGLVEETRAARSELVTAQEALRVSLGSLAAAIKSESSTTAAESPGSAPERLRKAVLSAADGIPDVTAATGYGLAEMRAYAADVDELRAFIDSYTTTVRDDGTDNSAGGGARASAAPSPSPSPSASDPQPVDTPTETPSPDPGSPTPDPGVTIDVPVG